MRELHIDEKKIFNFSQKYVDSQIAEIKKTFSSKCKNDSTLSKEYKEHITDKDNINVTFKPKYGYNIYATFNSIHAKYQFTYTMTYSTGSHMSGEVKINSDGKADVSGLRTVKEYSSSDTTSTGSTSFYSTAMKTCEMKLGPWTSSYYDEKRYVDVTNAPVSTLPKQLVALASAPFTYQQINPYMTVHELPSYVYDEMKQKAIEFYSYGNPRDFSMTITDYSIDELYVTFLPYAYSFDVWTNFEGETFKLKDLDSISDITSKGPESQHYKTFLDHSYQTERDFHRAGSPEKKIYGLSIAIAALMVILSASMLIFAKPLKIEAIRHFYIVPTIIMLLASLVITVISICLTAKYRTFSISRGDYDRSLSSDMLLKKLQQKMQNEIKKNKKKAFSWLIAVLIITSALGIGGGILFKASYNEHFWYTPEIINSYSGSDTKAFYKFTIISCDNEGNVKAVDESTYGEDYAKGTYNGKIIKKTKNEIQIDFSFDQAIQKPKKGRFLERMTVTITDDFKQLNNYDNIVLYATTPQTNADYSDIIKSYISYKLGTTHIIDIKSCDTNGKVTAVYTYVNDKGYAKRNLTGEILIENNSDKLFINFTAGDYTEQTTTTTIGDSVTASLSVADGTMVIGDINLSTAPNNVKFISSTSDISLMNNSANLFILTNDIDFGGASITPISSFKGSIIGNGYAIKNFKINSPKGKYVGFISDTTAQAGHSTFILDLSIENADVTASANGTSAGILCGTTHGSIYNVTVSGVLNAVNFENVGGVAGYVGGNVSSATYNGALSAFGKTKNS